MQYQKNKNSLQLRHYLLHLSIQLSPLIFIMFFLLSGCSVIGDRVDFNIGEQPVVYLNEYVRRNPPEIYLRPANEASNVKVLFVPFRVTQKIDGPEMIGYSVARSVWQTWAEMKIFEYMEFVQDAGPFRRDIALNMAKAKGADMVVGGYVTHYLPGSNLADTSLAIQLEAYDVSSGLQVWSMAQGGVMPKQKTNDYMIFATKRRVPADAMHAVIRALSSDMGMQMQAWLIEE